MKTCEQTMHEDGNNPTIIAQRKTVDYFPKTAPIVFLIPNTDLERNISLSLLISVHVQNKAINKNDNKLISSAGHYSFMLL